MTGLPQSGSSHYEITPLTSADATGSAPTLDLAALQQGLREAREELSPRQAVVKALLTTHTFLESIPGFGSEGLASPIFGLLLALQDLENGTVAPILESNARNRPPDPTAKKIMKAFCSYCVDQLNGHSGGPIDQHCRTVSSAIRGSGFRNGGREITWKNIKNWRDGVSKLSLNDHERRTLSQLRLELPEIGGISSAASISAMKKLFKVLHTRLGKYGSE